MNNINVNLQLIVKNINLPTVLKTAVLPGDSVESLFIATQVGEIFVIKNNTIDTFLNIRRNIIKLNDYDERGLVGLAFHPNFANNGKFYLHYSVLGTQGASILTESFTPNPCNPESLSLKWTNRKQQFDHIDTVEIATQRIRPLKSYFHEDSRPDKFAGTALTGVQVYEGTAISQLTGNIIFTDLAKKSREQGPTRGVLAYTKYVRDKLSDYYIIEPTYDFGGENAYFVSLGTNMNQTRLFLGVHHSMMVGDSHQGMVFEVVP